MILPFCDICNLSVMVNSFSRKVIMELSQLLYDWDLTLWMIINFEGVKRFTVKLLNFGMPEIFAVIYLKF